ncbi:MAG: hypothetical protein Terrestrivirus3_196 [Terrestrivirus sp.]|uniref:Uncharacterized protein n=1 Tax=Terrestrivirus sp. TaxID=2487775 RepID=A0A3G4ZM58_9VIRU|nr:MAG: hypothetical protein Terrestrivirus3_196 [Terrestrivirus sp.]
MNHHVGTNTETIFRELVNKQIRNIPTNKKLQLSDIKRISHKINKSIFDENVCSIWTGYITNTNNTSKGMYVNFYFRKKKVALHRLLYCNFVGDLGDDEYLKYNCVNKGKCCNIHHMNKFKYNTNEDGDIDSINIDEIDNSDNSDNSDNNDNINNGTNNITNIGSDIVNVYANISEGNRSNTSSQTISKGDSTSPNNLKKPKNKKLVKKFADNDEDSNDTFTLTFD